MYAIDVSMCGETVQRYGQSSLSPQGRHAPSGYGRVSERGQFFSRAIDLDKKFALSHAGLGIAHANLKDKKAAKKHAAKAEGIAGKDPQVLALCAKVFIDLRSQEKKWHKDAKRLLKKALKRDKKHELSTYYTGEMHLYRYEFSEAEDSFRAVVNMKGEHSGRADKLWQLSQKIVRAMPGTDVGKKVALYEKITVLTLRFCLQRNLKLAS